jgi:radical SAM superfamily enzyme YgiQ (UPF0313 family)
MDIHPVVPLLDTQSFTKHIGLIIPPSGFLLDERVFMTLGILKVAAVLEKAGANVEVLDLSGVKNFAEAASDYAASRPLIVQFGITATTPQMPAVSEIVRAIRKVRADAKIILGGPHITLVNAAYKKELARGITGRAVRAMEQSLATFDTLVAGDGEDAIFLSLGDEAPRVVDADDVHSPLFLTGNRLTELPFPARHLVDIDSYHYSIDGVSALSLIAQLGCPFACGFCGGRESPMLRRIRMRTSENIVQEMVHLYQTTGRRGFMMYDDELNVNKKVVELMRLIGRAQQKLGVEWRLRGFIKSQLFTDEQAAAMYEAGFRWILVGFESGSSDILRAINKRATREENTRCMEIARRHNLKVKALMSMGHPGETEETVMDTKRWLLEVEPDDFDLTIITCYPGTPYYDEAVPHPTQAGVWVYTYQKTGAKLYQYELDYSTTADYYKGDPNGGYRSYVFTATLSAERLVELRDHVERSVRDSLKIPFYQGIPAMLYEHSMGQGGHFPTSILRGSAT